MLNEYLFVDVCKELYMQITGGKADESQKPFFAIDANL
jgi:hypothetical protein